MAYRRQWDVNNSRNTGTYKVSERTDGKFECSCMSWTRNRLRKDCKHILEIKLLLVQETKQKTVQVEQPSSSVTRKLSF